MTREEMLGYHNNQLCVRSGEAGVDKRSMPLSVDWCASASSTRQLVAEMDAKVTDNSISVNGQTHVEWRHLLQTDSRCKPHMHQFWLRSD